MQYELPTSSQWVLNCWNSLPQSAVETNSVYCFKNQLEVNKYSDGFLYGQLVRWIHWLLNRSVGLDQWWHPQIQQLVQPHQVRYQVRSMGTSWPTHGYDLTWLGYELTCNHHNHEAEKIKMCLLFFPRFGRQYILLLLFVITIDFVHRTYNFHAVWHFPCFLSHAAIHSDFKRQKLKRKMIHKQ